MGRLLLTTALIIGLAPVVSAKPPGLPRDPLVEGVEPSPVALEFYQPENKTVIATDRTTKSREMAMTSDHYQLETKLNCHGLPSPRSSESFWIALKSVLPTIFGDS